MFATSGRASLISRWLQPATPASTTFLSAAEPSGASNFAVPSNDPALGYPFRTQQDSCRHPRIPMHAFGDVFRSDTELDLSEARQPAAYGRLQGAGRVEQVADAEYPRARAWSYRGVGGQSCAGSFLPRGAARDP